jgi:hypothetical protein
VPFALVLAAAAIAIGMATLWEYVFGVNLGIDQLLFHEAAGGGGSPNPLARPGP